MGNWNINIQGTGCHHNPNLATDADKMARRFVQDLLAAGHQVEVANFTAGSKTELVPRPAEAPADPDKR